VSAAHDPGNHVPSDLCHEGKVPVPTNPQPVIKATNSTQIISPREAPRDIIAMYARRTALSGWSKPRVTTTGPVVPVLFGRALHVDTIMPTEDPSPEVPQTVVADDVIPVFRSPRRSRPRVRIPGFVLHPVGGLRRLVTAAFVMTVVFGGLAQGTSAQQRYVVRDGDTLDSVASEFGVDADSILSSSYLPDAPNLSPGDVIVVPDPGQSPDEAAADAAAREGTSPWVAGAYYVEDGDSIESIAAYYDVDVSSIADLNGISE
jgi:LysM repeat protein